jgi:putative oxidoreductase
MWRVQRQEQITARTNIYSSASNGAAVHRVSQPTRIVIPFRPDIASSKNRSWYQRIERNPLVILRFSLAAVFFWFGVMKIAGVSPVLDLLRSSFPALADPPYLQLLGVAEVLIAVGLVINRLSKQATALMVLHLLGTLSVAVLAPRIVFAPAFPVLTMTGEFLAKNLVLIAAGIIIMISRE